MRLVIDGETKQPVSDGKNYGIKLSLFPPASRGKFKLATYILSPDPLVDAAAVLLTKGENTIPLPGRVDSGTLEITSLTQSEVAGTFEFDAVALVEYGHPIKYDTIIVRNGKFRVPITSYGEE